MKTIWYIQNCSLFRWLTPGQLRELHENARIREFPRHSSIYLPTDCSDAAFLVGKGRVRICSSTVDGKQAILSFVEPGEIFGELSVLESAQREDRAEAAMDSTIILLPGTNLRRIMEQSPALTLAVTKLIGMRRRRIERRLRNLLFRSGRDRLVHLLLELSEQYGVSSPYGIELGIKLSHQDLAAIIGITREFVSTTLGEMQSEGLIIIGRQKITIRDLSQLAKSVNAQLTIPDQKAPEREWFVASNSRFDPKSLSNPTPASESPVIKSSRTRIEGSIRS